MAKDTTMTKDATIEDLSTQIAILKDDIAALTSTVSDYGKSKSRQVAGQARTTAHDLANSGRDKALEAQDTAEEFIRTQPATAVGIAAGVGFLVGLIASRR